MNGPPERFRWVICGLLFAATTINYMDRQVLGLLAPTLQREMGWSETEYGFIVTAFQAAYAIGLLAFGRILDLIHPKRGYAIAIGIWSCAAMLHGAMRSAFGFGFARFLLGLGEAGNFPAAIKTVTEFFPLKERAFAVGLFNCGSNVGAIITPLVVPWIALTFGWPAAFYSTGAIGFLWIVAWLALYRNPVALPDRNTDARPSWMELIGLRQTWALIFARFLTDWVWWFYLYWAPKFLHDRYGLTLDKLGPPLIVIYLAADGGSVFGGWLSSVMIRRGWSVNAARKIAILLCACMVVPMAFGYRLSGVWMAVAVLSLATAGHQGWAANMFAMIGDIYPARAVGSVVGIAGFAGSVGAMLASTAIGFVLQATGSYVPVFVWAGCSYLIILGIIHVMIPRIEPMARRQEA